MDLSNKAYARCKACDSKFYPKRIGEDFDDMCGKCLIKMDEIENDNQQFIQGYIQDKT